MTRTSWPLLLKSDVRIGIVRDDLGPHLSTRTDEGGTWAAADNVELAHVPFYRSRVPHIEPPTTALRYFSLDDIDHATRPEQASLIRRHIAWRTVI